MEKKETPKEEQTIDPLAEAKSIRDEIKAENEKLHRQLSELKAIESQKILGGTTEVGKPEQPKKELTPQEYTKLVMSGKRPE